MNFRLLFLTVTGCVGAAISNAVGGFDMVVINLLVLMAIDYVTGIIVAAVFKKSKKTTTGGVSSHASFVGLLKKCMIMVLVVVANILDRQLDTQYIRDWVCIAFIVNEVMSIIENAGLMGLPIPKVLKDALELLRSKGGEE